MEGKTDLYLEIRRNNLEPEYILLSIKGLLKHLMQVESKIYVFFEILSYDDFQKITHILKTLKRFLKYILDYSTVYKRPILRALKGTYV